MHIPAKLGQEMSHRHANIAPPGDHRHVKYARTQRTRDIEPMLGWCWPTVYDVGPTSTNSSSMSRVCCNALKLAVTSPQMRMVTMLSSVKYIVYVLHENRRANYRLSRLHKLCLKRLAMMATNRWQLPDALCINQSVTHIRALAQWWLNDWQHFGPCLVQCLMLYHSQRADPNMLCKYQFTRNKDPSH